jgi:hypothetical protein
MLYDRMTARPQDLNPKSFRGFKGFKGFKGFMTT